MVMVIGIVDIYYDYMRLCFAYAMSKVIITGIIHRTKKRIHSLVYNEHLYIYHILFLICKLD